MARNLTSNFITDITSESIAIIILAKFEFGSGDVRLWTGLRDLEFNNEVYTGVADLGTIEPIVENETLQASGLSFQLSGIPSSQIAIALTEDYQERTARLYLGIYDISTNAVTDSYLLFRGRMDVMEIEEGPETATIRLSAENRLIDLERARTRRYTPEDHKIDWPNDTFFDYVADLQDKELIWGQR